MPSPVGHLFAGTIVYLAATRRTRRSAAVLAVALCGALAPDLDFVPGIAIGNMRAFHHGISHSIVFALLFGVATFLVAARWCDRTLALLLSMVATAAYGSHVFLDFISVNPGAKGVPLVWPLSHRQFGVNLHLFGHFRYTDIRDGLWSVVRSENLYPFVRELAILGGLAGALFLSERIATRFRTSGRD
jgi:inner membrane protein